MSNDGIWQVRDIQLSDVFMEDYESLPPDAKRRMGNKIDLIIKGGRIPRSVNAHRVDYDPDLWIGYLTQGVNSFRFLFRLAGGLLRLERVFNHRDMDKYLKEMF